jgi:hypothetical protein
MEILMEYEIEQISRQIQRLEDSHSNDVGVSEMRHREIMDYMLTLKMESDKRHDTVKILLYINLAWLGLSLFFLKVY